MAKSSISRAASRFRQLCCLGSSSEIVMPALLGELHSLIPSLANTFYFTDAKGETTHIYLENTEYLRLLPVYWEVVHERDERAYKGSSFLDAAQTQFGAHTFESSVATSRDAFFRSDGYNLTQRVVGYDPNFMRLIVRRGGRALGGVRMWRSLGRGTWTSEEQRHLGALEPFFVHALTVHDAGETPLVNPTGPASSSPTPAARWSTSPERAGSSYSSRPILGMDPTQSSPASTFCHRGFCDCAGTLGASSPTTQPPRRRATIAATCGEASTSGPSGWTGSTPRQALSRSR